MDSDTQKLGRYELLERIAQGGMGEIFLAKTRGAGGFEKDVIIKTILEHLAQEEEFVEKFLDEGRTVVQLVHGNIVPVFDMGKEDNRYFIAMEYIAGRDLREVIKRVQIQGGQMPINLSLYVASEALKGLHYAHQKTTSDGESLGIVHRDISPSNILISSEGDIKIIDFGIARAATRLSKTATGRLQGKFCYMSPEQAAGQKLGPSSDVFSLGTSLYEMLTGFRPFEGQTDLESLDLARKCEFDPPSTLNPNIPDEVDEIVAKALARTVDDRYESAEKMQVDILQYLYSSASAPTGSDVARFLSELFPEGLERKELRAARGSGSSVDKLNLDNALDAEIDRLLAGTNEIDPRATTAVSQGARPETHTSTQFQTPGPSQDSVPSVVSAVTGPQTVGAKRYFVGAIAIGVLIGVVGMIWSSTAGHSASVSLKSSPSGADVWVDGARVVGAQTPYTVELEEGNHRIRLEYKGHEPLVLNVPITSKDKTKVVDAAAGAVLKPKAKPRTFKVVATPADATLFRNNVALGVAPQSLELSQGDVANLRATREGCRAATYTLAYSHKASDIALQLDCAKAPTEVVEVAPTEDPKPTKTNDHAPVRVSFDSDPPGATVRINGKSIGTAPVERTFSPAAVVSIEMNLDGYQPATLKGRARSLRRRTVLKLENTPMGCVNVSLVSPQVADVSIDGKSIGQVQRVKRGIKVSAGQHQVTASNEAAAKSESKKITVENGTRCSTVVLFGD